MISFAPEFLGTIRQRVRVSQVASKRTRLIKKGREFSGLCPFHNEKTPSFTVNDDKEFYHCFGCGAHGDVISFVMATEGLNFPESVAKLASEAGIPMPQDDTPRNPEYRREQDRLKAVVEAGAKWFYDQLKRAAGTEASDYLQLRGVNAANIAKFRLGFAPSNGTLKTDLQKLGFTDAEMIDAGLLIVRDEKPNETLERFRNRLIFPICDKMGAVIGFGGRALGEAQPKYLNSPDTKLFQKGEILYAHHLARIGAKSSPVIVVEGYLDVIALHQAGFSAAVAPLGTALTESQMNLLWRMNSEPLLCFDGDNAGIKAANRAAMRALPLLAPGRSLRFVALPQGQDPDDLLKTRGGLTLMKQKIEAARPLFEQVFEAERDSMPHATPEQRADFKRRLRMRLKDIADADIRQFYGVEFKQLIERLFGISEGLGQRGELALNGGGFRGKPGFGGFHYTNNGTPLWLVPQTERGRGWSGYPPPLLFNDRFPKSSTDPKAIRINLVEKPLLALIGCYPIIALENLEFLAKLHFVHEELDQLRLELVNQIATNPDIEEQELQTNIHIAGHSPSFGAVMAFSCQEGLPIANPEKVDLATAKGIFGSIAQQIVNETLEKERLDLIETLPFASYEDGFQKLKQSYEPSRIEYN